MSYEIAEDSFGLYRAEGTMNSESRNQVRRCVNL
jgi:hypothetical protein